MIATAEGRIQFLRQLAQNSGLSPRLTDRLVVADHTDDRRDLAIELFWGVEQGEISEDTARSFSTAVWEYPGHISRRGAEEIADHYFNLTTPRSSPMIRRVAVTARGMGLRRVLDFWPDPYTEKDKFEYLIEELTKSTKPGTQGRFFRKLFGIYGNGESIGDYARRFMLVTKERFFMPGENHIVDPRFEDTTLESASITKARYADSYERLDPGLAEAIKRFQAAFKTDFPIRVDEAHEEHVSYNLSRHQDPQPWEDMYYASRTIQDSEETPRSQIERAVRGAIYQTIKYLCARAVYDYFQRNREKINFDVEISHFYDEDRRGGCGSTVVPIDPNDEHAFGDTLPPETMGLIASFARNAAERMPVPHLLECLAVGGMVEGYNVRECIEATLGLYEMGMLPVYNKGLLTRDEGNLLYVWHPRVLNESERAANIEFFCRG